MLRLKKVLFDEIIVHCREQSPNEACGILAGKGARAEKVYMMTNTDKSPATYFMDVEEQFKVMKEIRSLGLEMVGIYHSHLESLAYPSSHDVELAFYPETSYVIVSFKDKHRPSVRSFKINEGRITEEEVKIE